MCFWCTTFKMHPVRFFRAARHGFVHKHGNADTRNTIYYDDGAEDDENAVRVDGFETMRNVVMKHVQDPFYFKQEADMMRHLSRHKLPFVIETYKIDEARQCLFFFKYDMDLFDAYERGLLSTHPKALDQTERRKLVREIALGICAIHDIHIAHRDIKPENILVNYAHTGLSPVLMDFGLAAPFQHIDSTKRTAGSKDWVAPEIAARIEHEVAPTDWFSFGLVAFVILTGTSFFADYEKCYKNRDAFYALLLRDGWPLTWDYVETFSPKLKEDEKELLEACVCIDPTKRGTAASIRALPFFT
jgi:serine/threonine protein kinase